ncbi:MAG: GNAT family N-acetyltransferase [Paenibacillus sp. RIFOXYA1_FULL_44_5]|nr:MAG: GNAT family N-acetyltransferase [Paenibacillus sp. RIFOXYA1_FULL_44_5]
MLIRTFQLSDYASASNLLETVLADCCYEETMDAFAKQLSWDGELILVAEVNHQIAGLIIGTIDKNKGYYYRIAVHQDHQRKGIGKLLVNTLRERFEKRKVNKILVTLDSHNENLIPLYESLGFSPADFFRSFQNLSILSS